MTAITGKVQANTYVGSGKDTTWTKETFLTVTDGEKGSKYLGVHTPSEMTPTIVKLTKTNAKALAAKLTKGDKD